MWKNEYPILIVLIFFNSYRKAGMGKDWAGHSKLILFPSRTDSTIEESLRLTLGATLPTGSIKQKLNIVYK